PPRTRRCNLPAPDRTHHCACTRESCRSETHHRRCCRTAQEVGRLSTERCHVRSVCTDRTAASLHGHKAARGSGRFRQTRRVAIPTPAPYADAPTVPTHRSERNKGAQASGCDDVARYARASPSHRRRTLCFPRETEMPVAA